MRVSIDWLSGWIDAGWDCAEFTRRLTMAGLEVEAVEPAAPAFTGVVVARVIEVGPHPDAAKLSVCRVDDGSGEPLQIVCGAPNARAGMTAALARIGAQLPGGTTIGEASLRGVASSGMLCSARELGLGEGHEGILDLPGDLTPGTGLRVALKLDDTILELALTPNRGDVMSIAGVAREVAAISGRPLNAPVIEPVAATIRDRFEVRLPAAAGCPRFAGRVIRGVRTDALTPLWMTERLRRSGLRAISPVVDVTNYVMLELGQPMHAYDLRRLDGHIEVRHARQGEQLLLLDGQQVTLDGDVLVIADAAGPIGIAGVMGGERSGIAADTRDVFLEVAYFDPDAVAGRGRRYGMITDASQRFERGVDPRLQERALERATRLLMEIAGGRPGPAALTEVAEHLPRRPSVKVEPGKIARVLGVEIPRMEIDAILRRLGMQAAAIGDILSVIPPSYRFDIQIAEDLIEEIARIYGYDRIGAADAIMPQVPQPAGEQAVTRRRVMTLLADRGYQEAITYSFVDPAMAQLFEPGAPHLALSNPIAADMGLMRRSLWPGLVGALGGNVRRQQDRVRLFEIGTRFVVDGEGLQESTALAGLAWGTALPEQWGSARREVDFHDVKGDLEALFALTGRQSSLRFNATPLACLHPGRSARIEDGSTELGWIGELHPALCRSLDLKQAPVLFELDFKSSFRMYLPVYKELSRFPVIRRDLAVVVDEQVTLEEIRENVRISASGLLHEFLVFDIYRGPGIEAGRKSIALGLILQESSRTLTDADADQVMSVVVSRLKNEQNATIRD